MQTLHAFWRDIGKSKISIAPLASIVRDSSNKTKWQFEASGISGGEREQEREREREIPELKEPESILHPKV